MSKQYDENDKVGYIQKQRQVVDTETGEISYETEIYKKVYGQKQFYKLYLFDLLNALGMFSTSKQLDVLIYVLSNVDSNNVFIGTYKKIQEDTEASYLTVQRAMTNLMQADIIRLQQQGVYKVNPNLIVKGNDIKKGRLSMEYEVLSENEDKKNPSDSDENPKENPNI